jgi:hypothetical protein
VTLVADRPQGGLDEAPPMCVVERRANGLCNELASLSSSDTLVELTDELFVQGDV